MSQFSLTPNVVFARKFAFYNVWVNFVYPHMFFVQLNGNAFFEGVFSLSFHDEDPAK